MTDKLKKRKKGGCIFKSVPSQGSVESQVFQARPPESLKYSDQFRNFYAREGESLRGEIVKSVREVTQSHTVQAVQQKVNAYMGPSQKPQDKPVQEMER